MFKYLSQTAFIKKYSGDLNNSRIQQFWESEIAAICGHQDTLKCQYLYLGKVIWRVFEAHERLTFAFKSSMKDESRTKWASLAR